MTSGRTWLFVPGTTPARFARAAGSGADQVIIDWEDAVPPGEKDAVREPTTRWLAGQRAWVRINAVDTPWHGDDLAALDGVAGLVGIVVPKAEDPDQMARIHDRLGLPIVALIETAIGVHRVGDVAAAPGVGRLALGSLDLAHDLGCAPTDAALLAARSAVVLASRLAGLIAPIDSVTTTFRDTEQVRADAERARELGFGGKLCIHPDQLGAASAGLAPRAEQIRWARSVLATAERTGGGVGAAVDGQMIDRPVIERARALLAEAEARR